jgi:hypothetical protein
MGTDMAVKVLLSEISLKTAVYLVVVLSSLLMKLFLKWV